MAIQLPRGEELDAPRIVDINGVPYACDEILEENDRNLIVLATRQGPVDPALGVGDMPEEVVIREDITGDPKRIAQFRKAYEVRADLRDIVSEVELADCCAFDPDQRRLVSNYIPGMDLEDIISETFPLREENLDNWDALLNRFGPPALEVFRSLIRSVTQTLVVLCNVGVVHRDIKPSCIVVRTQQDVESLLDLSFLEEGAATAGIIDVELLTEANCEGFESVIGEVMFMPVEVREGRDCSSTRDIYSLCVSVLYAADAILGFKTFQEGSSCCPIETYRVASRLNNLSDLDRRNWVDRYCRFAPEAIVPYVFGLVSLAMEGTKPAGERPRDMEEIDELLARTGRVEV